MKIPVKMKIDSLVAIGNAVAFQWFFMFTKHDPRLRPLIPFGDDPYDALGSSAAIVNIFLCLLLLWRTFRPAGSLTTSPMQLQHVRRAQAAVPLSILVTLAADAVAMIRHQRTWIGTASQNLLLASFVGVTVVSATCLYSIQCSTPRSAMQEQRSRIAYPATVAVVFFSMLTIYPERLIDRLSTHLVTVIIGDLLLFVPVSALLLLLLPDMEHSIGPSSKSPCATVYLWTGTSLIGLAIGVALFFGEMTEGGGPLPPLRLRLIVAAVYTGLSVAGMLIAFAFLKGPLGLTRRRTAQSN